MTIIRIIDFETTGMEPPAQVVEVGYCDLTNEGHGWTVRDPVSWLCGVDAIPPETRAAHHITLSEVVDLEPFGDESVVELIGGVWGIAAHNLEFEDRFLKAPDTTPKICTYKAALRIWPEAPGHSNSVLRYWLEDQGLLSLEHAKAMPPHRAGPDAYVTAHILKALLSAGATGKDMLAWTKEPRLFPTCPIGKFKGKPWSEVEAGFLSWMMKQPTMEDDLKWNAEREIARRSQGA